jgi:hypothetical protein
LSIVISKFIEFNKDHTSVSSARDNYPGTNRTKPRGPDPFKRRSFADRRHHGGRRHSADSRDGHQQTVRLWFSLAVSAKSVSKAAIHALQQNRQTSFKF